MEQGRMNYLERKQCRKQWAGKRSVVSQTSIDSLYEDSLRDNSQIELIKPIEITYGVNDAKLLIATLSDQFNGQRLEQLFMDVKRDVVASIVPLGMGSKLAEYDHLGGNVDTTYNVREKIYATEDAEKAYNDRLKYEPSDYHNGSEKYNEKQRVGNAEADNGTLIDESTGQRFERGKDGKIHKALDHTIPASTLHDDRAANLAEMDTVDLANSDENLQFINPKVNLTKGAKSNAEYVATIDEKIREKNARISRLEAKDTLSDQEQRELANAKVYVEDNGKINKQRMLESEKEAQEAIDNKVDETYYKSEKFRKNSIAAATNTAKRAGVTAALGRVLTLFMSGMIDEVIDCWKNGKETDSNIKELRVRIGRIVKKCTLEWKSIVGVGFGAAASGFFSELATIFINTFATTTKRTVTLIREGGFSLLRALKLILSPPEGMTLIEATHEATKIFATGMIAASGILVQNMLDTYLTTVLPYGSELISTIIIGALIAITSCLVVYIIDKADFFKVTNNKKQDFVNNALENYLTNEIERTKQLSMK